MSFPKGPTRRWTRPSGSTVATTGRIDPPPNGRGSSTSWSEWWLSARSNVTRRCSATHHRLPGYTNAPPFLVIHGSRDGVIPVAQARSFVERLRAVSRSLVAYVELPGAGHGFDLLDRARTGSATHAISLFLNQIHRTRAQLSKEVI